jgi:hypothetical protein
MIESNHIKGKLDNYEGTKKCSGSAKAAAGRSFAEPTISPFGADLHPAID